MGLKEDLLACLAELVDEQTLRVSGDFVPGINIPWSGPQNSPTPQSHVSTFVLVPTSQHGLHKAWVSSDLSSAKFVFVHPYAHRRPLKLPYDEPLSMDKTFGIGVGGRSKCVSNALNQLTETWIGQLRWQWHPDADDLVLSTRPASLLFKLFLATARYR